MPDYTEAIKQLMRDQEALADAFHEKLKLIATTIDALKALENGKPAEPAAPSQPKAKKVYEWKPSARLRKGVLDVFRAWPTVTLKDIADHSKIPHGSVTKIVRVLVEEGAVEQLPQRNEHNAYEYQLNVDHVA